LVTVSEEDAEEVEVVGDCEEVVVVEGGLVEVEGFDGWEFLGEQLCEGFRAATADVE
jgi:hypothetical protein